MSIVQLNIFDDVQIRQNDSIFKQLVDLQNEGEMHVEDLQIKRNKKFYVVEKDSEFEVVFLDVQSCYEFMNQYL